MVLCQDEATTLGHTVLLPQHLLLGLMRLEAERTGPAGPLRQLGLHAEELRSIVTAEANSLAEAGPAGDSPKFTRQTKKVLESSMREALQLGDSFISPGHMLLGLLREGTPRALSERVDLPKARQAVALYHRVAPELHPMWGAAGGVAQPSKGILEVIKTALSFSTREKSAGSQHILLTLVSREDTLAGRILKELGVTEEKVRDLIERLGTEGTVDEPEEPSVEIVVQGKNVSVRAAALRDAIGALRDQDPEAATALEDALRDEHS